ncbi:MAG: hypothetical protein II938_03495 [Alphaproteobacteria bacterium]|nr:hypothetical protein [Alphaproteobacteria bacterium]
MLKIFRVLAVLVLFLSGACFAGVEKLLPENEVIVFTQATCSHCWAAEDYIKENYPNLTVQWREVSDAKNWQLFLACAAKFKLDRSKLGTPLFCMGPHYIMGWGRSERKQFDEYVKDFYHQEAQLSN